MDCHTSFERTAEEAAKEVLRHRHRKEGVFDRVRRIIRHTSARQALTHWITVSAIVFAVVFALLALGKPSFVVREEQDGRKQISWFMVLVIALAFAGACSFLCLKFCQDSKHSL